jgi:hypothetical protein
MQKEEKGPNGVLDYATKTTRIHTTLKNLIVEDDSKASLTKAA